MPRVHQAQVGHSFWASLRRGAGAWPVLVWAATLTGILVMSGGLSVFAGDSAGAFCGPDPSASFWEPQVTCMAGAEANAVQLSPLLAP